MEPRIQVAWLVARAAGIASTATNMTLDNWTAASWTGVTQAGTGTNATTYDIIAELQFAAARSVRTSTIVLASFNAAAAAGTAGGILYRAHRTAQHTQSRLRVPPGEVFPLAVSAGVVVQAVSFAVAQAQGLAGLTLTEACPGIAQYMLPAVFVVPLLQAALAAEQAVRSFPVRQRLAFRPRGRFATPGCLGVAGILLVGLLVLASVQRAPEQCFAELFWFLTTYAQAAFALMLVLVAVLVASAACIIAQLTRSTGVDAAERAAASRTVYYVVAALLSAALVVPFFGVLAFGNVATTTAWNRAITLAMVATVVANVTGLVTGGLYLFLKSSAHATIGPRDSAAELACRRVNIKGSIRRYDRYHATDPSDPSACRANNSQPDFAGHMMGPVGSRTDVRTGSEASLVSRGSGSGSPSPSPAPLPKDDEAAQFAVNPLRANAYAPQAPAPVQTVPDKLEREMGRYSFASAVSAVSAVSIASADVEPARAPSMLLLPATTYAQSQKQEQYTSQPVFDLAALMPPLPPLMPLRHRRDSSLASSATVQIGLRLSNANDFRPLDSQVLDPRLVDTQVLGRGVYRPPSSASPSGLVVPMAMAMSTVAVPPRIVSPTPAPLNLSPKARPPPAQAQSLALRRPSPLASARVSVLTTDTAETTDTAVLLGADYTPASPRRDPTKDARMKTLPPVPSVSTSIVAADAQQLSPSVYSPASPSPSHLPSPTLSQAPSLTATTKLTSPRGVGFASVVRSNSATGLRPAASAASLQSQSQSQSQPQPTDAVKTSEWI